MVPIETTGGSAGRRLGAILRFGMPGAVVGMALAWWGLGGSTVPSLQAQSVSQAPSGLIALTTEAAGDAGGSRLVVIDPRQLSMAVYKIDGFKGGAIKLEAARRIGGDLRLSEYNNLAPEVAAVEAMVAAPRPRGNSGQ